MPQATIPGGDKKIPQPQKQKGEAEEKKKREERLFENLIWIWTLDLMPFPQKEAVAAFQTKHFSPKIRAEYFRKSKLKV